MASCFQIFWDVRIRDIQHTGVSDITSQQMPRVWTVAFWVMPRSWSLFPLYSSFSTNMAPQLHGNVNLFLVKCSMDIWILQKMVPRFQFFLISCVRDERRFTTHAAPSWSEFCAWARWRHWALVEPCAAHVVWRWSVRTEGPLNKTLPRVSSGTPPSSVGKSGVLRVNILVPSQPKDWLISLHPSRTDLLQASTQTGITGSFDFCHLTLWINLRFVVCFCDNCKSSYKSTVK